MMKIQWGDFILLLLLWTKSPEVAAGTTRDRAENRNAHSGLAREYIHRGANLRSKRGLEERQLSDQQPATAISEHSSAFSPEESQAPMPKAEFVIISNGQWCLSSTDGNYGLQMGDKVNLSFFYQIEAEPGTTEAQINGNILDDLEIALMEAILPDFFQECEGPSRPSKSDRRGYIGMSTKPSDYVLRGFSCSTVKEPCFIISGSMTAYIKGIDHSSAQKELRKAIYRAMDNGAMEAKAKEVDRVSLLDESLNLATLPTSNAPTPQFFFSQTPIPTPSPPTVAPTTDSLSSDHAPTSTATLEPTWTSSTQPAATGSMNPTNVAVETGPEMYPANLSGLPQPEASAPANSQFAYEEDSKSAFEKVPVWIWIVAALAVCICCSYTDPNDEEEDKSINQKQETRGLAAVDNHYDKTRDSMQDSEALNSGEFQYVRKLYRQ